MNLGTEKLLEMGNKRWAARSAIADPQHQGSRIAGQVESRSSTPELPVRLEKIMGSDKSHPENYFFWRSSHALD